MSLHCTDLGNGLRVVTTDSESLAQGLSNNRIKKKNPNPKKLFKIFPRKHFSFYSSARCEGNNQLGLHLCYKKGSGIQNGIVDKIPRFSFFSESNEMDEVFLALPLNYIILEKTLTAALKI